MSMADKKAAMVDAMMTKKGLNLSAVTNKCGLSNTCDGSADIYASDTAVLKKQFVKKISTATTVDLTSGSAKFSFPNVKTDQKVYVSQTVYSDEENPLAALDANSVGTMDCEVFADDANGDVQPLVITGHPNPIGVTLNVPGAANGYLAYYDETAQKMVKVADCTDVAVACTGTVDHLTTFTMSTTPLETEKQANSQIVSASIALMSVLALFL